MEITKNNVETTVDILTLLAEKKCTVADAQDILSYVSKAIPHNATVPKLDYRAELDCLFKVLSEDGDEDIK